MRQICHSPGTCEKGSAWDPAKGRCREKYADLAEARRRAREIASRLARGDHHGAPFIGARFHAILIPKQSRGIRSSVHKEGGPRLGHATRLWMRSSDWFVNVAMRSKGLVHRVTGLLIRRLIILAIFYGVAEVPKQRTLGAAAPPPEMGEMQAGGGGRLSQRAPCIPVEEQLLIRSNIADWNYMTGHALHRQAQRLTEATGFAPARYQFYPHAGELWADLFPNNFVDLDPTTDVLDYNGTEYTYDGHAGIDTDIPTFTEQAIGVPVFAALNGTVLATHDGEPDMNTERVSGRLANYVVISHERTHETWYYHLKKSSVSAREGARIRAGEQIGLTGSSGFSDGPHLHFESQFAGRHFEPFSGPANPRESGWVSQIPFRSETYLRDLNFTLDDLSNWPGPPIDTTRTGTLKMGDQYHRIWVILHNLPAHSVYQLRYFRPDGSLRYASGSRQLGGGNPFYRWSWWWFNYHVNFDAPGTWTVEFSVNAKVLEHAPLTISSAPETNRPPFERTAALDPAQPTSDQVVFCRIPNQVIDDPDYDVVRFRYLWRRNGEKLRDATTASLADAIPRDSCVPGDILTCTVTPGDGKGEAPPITVSFRVRQSIGAFAADAGLPATADPESDADNDGIPLLVEYYLNLSPSTVSELPLPERDAETGELRWTLLPNPLLAAGVSAGVFTSTNLTDWIPAMSIDGAVWRAGTAADTHRFLTLRVSRE